MIQQMIRKPLRSAPRRMFGVFVVCWLNMAIAPCAMALQGEQDCPHGSPQVAEQMGAHHGHHDAGPAHDCATVLADCCEVAAASVDTRGGKLKSDADDVVVVAVSFRCNEAHAFPTYCIAAHPPDPVATSRPLHKLHCVYLN